MNPFKERIPVNPFEPDREASPEIFAGRVPEVMELRRLLVETARNDATNLAIVGERGIGKTSLLNYVYSIAPSFPDFDGVLMKLPAVVTVALGSCGSIEDIATAIINEIYRSTRLNTRLNGRLEKLFNRIQSISFSGFGVKIADKASRESLVLTFHQVIADTVTELGDEFSGLVIILDETDRVSELRGFPDFLKNTAEQIRRNGVTNVSFVISMIPSSYQNLREINPSFPRIFKWVELHPLSEIEVRELVDDALSRGFPVKAYRDDFLEVLLKTSDGTPSFVQHIAYYAFEHDTDDKITGNDCWNGLFGTSTKSGALAQLEKKYFEQLYVDLVKTDDYRDVLLAMAIRDENVSLAELRESLPSTIDVSACIKNLVSRGIVVKNSEKRGVYRLPSNAFRLFLRIQAFRDAENRNVL